VTVIFGTAPQRSNWQLVWYCTPLKFSGLEALKIPGDRGRDPRGSGTDTTGFLGSGRPWLVKNRGGLSVLETLHLVSDIAKGYQMF